MAWLADTLSAPESRRPAAPHLSGASGLLRRRAQKRGDTTAIVDIPNRSALGLGPQRRLSYRQADRAVDGLARFLRDLGLAPGDRIGVQLPLISEQPLMLLAAWRAGLTVCTLPLLWRRSEIDAACALLEPKALVGIGRFGGVAHAEMLCRAAAQAPSVRFVLGFGENLPDGVTPLAEAFDEPNSESGAIDAEDDLDCAAVTFTAQIGEPVMPLFRSMESLLAQGGHAAAALGLNEGDVLLNPYPLTGPVGLGIGLMAWLVSGCTLVLHQPFDYDLFRQQLADTQASVTVVPSPVLDALEDDGVLQMRAPTLARVACVWAMPDMARFARPANVIPLCDVYPIADFAALLRKRDPAQDPALLPLGGFPFGMDDLTAVETSLDGNGVLSLGGALTPRISAELNGERFEPTGWRGRVAAADASQIQIERAVETYCHGGFSIAAAELDELYASFPGFLDAASFALPDPVVGDRIFAAVVARPEREITFDKLGLFLDELEIATYKKPDRLVIVKTIPRDLNGHVIRDQILRQI